MNKSIPDQRRRLHPFKVRVALIAVVAFLSAALFPCMCDWSCGDRLGVADKELTVSAGGGCCSSCTPVRQSEHSSNEDSGQSDCGCCLSELPDYEHVQALGNNLDAPVRVAEVIERLVPPPAELFISPSLLLPEASSGSPPAYLRFEILLI